MKIKETSRKAEVGPLSGLTSTSTAPTCIHTTKCTFRDMTTKCTCEQRQEDIKATTCKHMIAKLGCHQRYYETREVSKQGRLKIYDKTR